MGAVETVVICAAGTGSRLGVGVPKSLVSIDGRSIIDRQLDLVDHIPDLRVAVGFREELVVRHVAARRPDAIFVRNPDYQTTTTLHSLIRAVQHLDRPFLAIDGDLLIEPASFERFLDGCGDGPPFIGITPSSTDDAVFVTISDSSGAASVDRFHRSPAAPHEWSGPALLTKEHLKPVDGYVYEAIEHLLPLRAMVVETAEVDTPDDLERARETVRRWDCD